jgi:hypothetical protein
MEQKTRNFGIIETRNIEIDYFGDDQWVSCTYHVLKKEENQLELFQKISETWKEIGNFEGTRHSHNSISELATILTNNGFSTKDALFITEHRLYSHQILPNHAKTNPKYDNYKGSLLETEIRAHLFNKLDENKKQHPSRVGCPRCGWKYCMCD